MRVLICLALVTPTLALFACLKASDCESDGDCNGGDVCSNGVCVECEDDAGCADGEVCTDNSCEPNPNPDICLTGQTCRCDENVVRRDQNHTCADGGCTFFVDLEGCRFVCAGGNCDITVAAPRGQAQCQGGECTMTIEEGFGDCGGGNCEITVAGGDQVSCEHDCVILHSGAQTDDQTSCGRNCTFRFDSSSSGRRSVNGGASSRLIIDEGSAAEVIVEQVCPGSADDYLCTAPTDCFASSFEGTCTCQNDCEFAGTSF